MEPNRRIVRVPLAPEILRQIDDLIATGMGGFQDRADFIGHAVESQILELTYPLAEGEPELPTPASVLAQPARDPRPNVSISETALGPATAMPIEAGGATIERDVLYGLHNRDYPSLWAAHFLGTHYDGPTNLNTYLEEVTDAAWGFGILLDKLGGKLGLRLTPIFPTNRDKPEAAVEGFRAFAIGEFFKSDPHKVRGPLFEWGLCDLSVETPEPMIGLTLLGVEVLDSLKGIDASVPHREAHARSFLSHLQHHAPEDFWGFKQTLDAIAEGVNRQELIDRTESLRPEWTIAQRETNAAGYVSRSREWGAVEAQQVNRRYVLSGLGERLVEEWR